MRFRDVPVGLVEKTSISEDLTKVIVSARIDKDVARFLDEDAEFWVVRPSVSAQGVSGIETVISGVYIDSYWNDQIGVKQTRFDALPRAPLTPTDQPGIRVRLRAPDGASMTIGAPVLFKRLQVGKVEDVSLTPAGDVVIDLFIGAPNDVWLTEATRFWNASGFSINLGGGGASLNVESLISLLQGGVSFDNVGSDLAKVEDGHVFELYPSEADRPAERVRGHPRRAGRGRHRLRRLGPRPAAGRGGGVPRPQGRRGALDAGDRRRRGRRAGDQAPRHAGADPAAPRHHRPGDQHRPRRRARPPRIPGRAGPPRPARRLGPAHPEPLHRSRAGARRAAGDPRTRRRAQPAAAERAVRRRQHRRLGREHDPARRQAAARGLVNAAVSILENANAIVTSDGVRQAPENLGLLLADARRLIGESGIQEAPAQVAAILASARALVDQATQQQLVANLNDVLATAKTSLASIGTAADGVPELLSQVEALAAKANGLPLDQLVASANDVVDGIDAFVRSDGVTALPASAQASLDDLRAVVADLRTGGAVDNLNATLASARSIADQAAQAQLVTQLNDLLATTKASVASVGAAADGVPPLLDQAEALAAKANALPLDQLVASANGVLGSIDAFVKSEDFAKLPASAQASLAELRGVVVDLRAGGAVENVTASLASVRQITDELAAAELVDSIKTVVAEAEAAIDNLNSASQGLPKLMDSVNAISGNIEALPLEDLVTTGTRVLGTADAFLASQGVQDVPPKLNAALDELRAILAELNAGGAAQNVNSTLASASRAADAVTVAAADLPALVARFSAVANAADAALASVGPNSRISRETLQLLQEVRDAARSVDQLARALQRQPNSVLFGR